MPITLNKISADTHPEYNDDVHVTGDVGERVVINMQRGKKLTIDGNISDNVTIKSYDVTLVANGKIGKNCLIDTYNGKVTVNGHIHEGSVLKTYNADIFCHHAGSKSSLQTYNGKITIDKLGHDAKVNSHNGNIEVKEAHESAKVVSNKGSVTINGVQQPKPEPAPTNFGRVTVFSYNTVNGPVTESIYHDPIVADNFTI